MTLQQYLSNLNALYISGNAREHAYRGDLQNLLRTILPDVLVTNEPARVSCGAPDYVLTRRDIPLGYVEAKDIGTDLKSKSLKEQFERYKAGLPNIIFTDYLEFQFYRNGDLLTTIKIGEVRNASIAALPENFETFIQLIKNFAETVTQTIKSPDRLAQMMAGRAKLMADVIEKSLDSDDKENRRSGLKMQMGSFKDMLIHDIDNKAFADIYAQTIAYGMFAARYHDPTLENFSREEAATLIPKSNPFLRRLFHDIAGPDLDDRLLWIVDELIGIFLATDVAKIMKNFGKSTKQEDPVVHFYETFLASYSPALRKARGVWYTPQPVVNFIVRAVDDILKTEFNLKEGLAHTGKIKIKVKAPKLDERSKTKSKIIGEQDVEQEVHKVQILDPATGTGTFLAEVVRHIYKKFAGQQGIWSRYVTNDLIPRLNGFELLMASYAMAHLKMDMLLTETGYKPTDDQRFKIYLTNSLEEHHPDTGTLFSSWLADEANQANAIKRDAPVMVVIGNPPYSISSSNKSKWILNLLKIYKDGLNERKINLDDDYIKFTRFGQYFIDKNSVGMLAYISNNSFIDGITHRQMRKSLLESFDKIYILDLHGSSKKKETSPDGSIDQNVFDIMQGVSINIFIKTGNLQKGQLGSVFHIDLYGRRNFKYEYLQTKLNNINWEKLKVVEPYYFFTPKNFTGSREYDGFIFINKLFKKYSSGIHTGKDDLVIDFDKDKLYRRIEETKNIHDENYIRNKYNLVDTSGWKLERFKTTQNNVRNYIKIKFRVFDDRWIIYENKALKRDRSAIMNNFFKKENYGLVTIRRSRSKELWKYVFISDIMTTEPTTITSLDNNYLFPLYLYPNESTQQSIDGEQARTPNLNPEMVQKIAAGLGLTFTNEKQDTPGTFAPIDVLDYIYAVLHSPAYREKYKEFLKIDFPRVPYPDNTNTFWQLVKLGGELRQVHLLESDIVEIPITQYLVDGDNIVDKPRFERGGHPDLVEASTGNVYINQNQYFAGVPEIAWNFYIGGYQPAQKWLKDRKGRELSYEDIFHYQKIIVALTETDRIMKEIDKLKII